MFFSMVLVATIELYSNTLAEIKLTTYSILNQLSLCNIVYFMTGRIISNILGLAVP